MMVLYRRIDSACCIRSRGAAHAQKPCPDRAAARSVRGYDDQGSAQPAAKLIHTELGRSIFRTGNGGPVAMEELTIAIYIDPTYAPAYGMRGTGA